MLRRTWILVVVVLALFTAACGGSDNTSSADTGSASDTGGDSTETPSESGPEADSGGDDDSDGGDDLGGSDGDSDGGDDLGGSDGGSDGDADDSPAETDPCDGVTLESTEIGVSADTITLVVMADVGSELAPGLFQGAMDGVNAWAGHINESGGLACRQVKVVEADSKISGVETVNGFLRGCDEALAMIGTYSLFALDVTDQSSCPDMAGNGIGIPDFAGIANNPPQQCSPNTFTTNSNNGSCPYDTGERTWSNQLGPMAWVLENDPLVADGANAVFIVPGDLPSTINSTVPGFVAQRDELGIVIDGMFGVSGRAAQSEYGEFVGVAQANDSNWLQTGSDDNSMLKLLREANAQGFDLDSAIKFCQLACYTENFLNDPLSEGTYIWGAFLPYNERDANAEMDLFLDSVQLEIPQSWAVSGWSAGLLLERVINEIVAADGPNAITRQSVLDTVAQITDFNANGMIANQDYVTARNGNSPCFVLSRVTNGELVRVHPPEAGTFDCTDSNVIPSTIDGLGVYQSDFG